MRDLEGLARIADEQLAAVAHRALVNAEQAELADEGIDRDFEHVRHDASRRIWFHFDAFGVITFALEEWRRITFSRAGHQAADDVEQFVHARTGLSGDEADRDEVTFAQRALEWIAQLLGIELLALLEIERHEVVIELDHLVDDLGVRLRPSRSPSDRPAAGRNNRRPCVPPSAGRFSGRHSRPNISRTWASVCLTCASRLSILLMITMRHRSRSFANVIIRSVTASTPEMALTTTPTVSTASRTLSDRPTKSGNPGVSIRLTRVSPASNVQIAASSECWSFFPAGRSRTRSCRVPGSLWRESRPHRATTLRQEGSCPHRRDRPVPDYGYRQCYWP